MCLNFQQKSEFVEMDKWFPAVDVSNVLTGHLSQTLQHFWCESGGGDWKCVNDIL